MQSVFAKRPLYASRIIWEQLKKAYYPKLKPGARTKYDRIIEQIIQEISSFPQAEQEEALKDTYLFGTIYSAVRCTHPVRPKTVRRKNK